MEGSQSSGSDSINSAYVNSLKVQILAYDSYQTTPSVLDQCYSTISSSHRDCIIASSKPFTQVPVIRVFGKLTSGHTVLLNVHNCFPYIFIDYDGDLDPEKARVKLEHLKLEIERLLYQSFRKVKLRKSNREGENEDDDIPDVFNDYSRDDNDLSNYENKYVASLALVKSVPFYGYHIGYSPFVKISLLNPRYMSRLCTMLLAGKVNGKAYQPYESHIPYLLQFMADYNLYGCDWMYLDNHLWRSPIFCDSPLGEFDEAEFEYSAEDIEIFNKMKINEPLKEFLASDIKQFKDESMIGEVRHGLNITSEDQFPRIGSTLLEMDCLPQWITNRKTLSTRDLHHDFVEIANASLANSTTEYLSSTAGILKDVQHQRMMRNMDNESFFSKLSLMYDGDIRNNSGETNWVEQAELNELLQHCIELSKKEYRKQSAPSFDTFVDNSSQYDNIQTPKENITEGVFKNIQWHKLVLATKSFSEFKGNSFSTISTSTPIDIRVLPSSMFDSQIIALSDPEDEPAEDNWMGTIPPHKSQVSTEESSSLDNSELDRLEVDLFSKPKLPAPKISEASEDVLLLSTKVSHSSMLDPDLAMFTQTSKKRVSFVLPPSSPVNGFLKQSKPSGSNFEFIGSTPLPQMSDHFLDSFEDQGMLKVEYPDPFYSKLTDVPPAPFIFAGTRFVLHSSDYSALPTVNIAGDSPSCKLLVNSNSVSKRNRMYEFHSKLPSFEEVDSWARKDQPTISRSQLLKSQIIQTTPNLKHGFKFPSAQKYKRKKLSFNKLIMLSVEVHVNTRGDLKPDPKVDEIAAIFWAFDKENYPLDMNISESGILILDPSADVPNSEKKYSNTTAAPVAVFDNEIMMVRELISIVKLIDPDLLAGFEIHGQSWGYIIERFREFYNIDLCPKLSRVIFKGNSKFGDRWGYNHASGITITGRHTMNLWRIFRGDVNLLKYTMENLAYHILHLRIPHYSDRQLTEWFTSGTPSNISAVLNYYMLRAKLDLEIVEKQEIISKTTEQARLIGVDFNSIFYRGSQFKVESFLVRLTKSENFMLISPSKQQVFKADALQCIPLIMEPSSAFYKSPLVVLDFQSLYPSIIIAYNYCYSTLLGRLRGYNAKYAQTIGVTKNKLEPGLLELLKDHITLSPNGLMYAKANVRKSLLAKMLTEILETRLAVKKTMTDLKDDYELNKLYNSRQLALKLLANVTYGYTSATFSGRMPCGDIADSIVSTGRETLNQSIRLIEANENWGAKVVYGDTDSLFVYFPGKSREEAFRIGKEAAAYITSINPKPVTLKFEKVYHPCVLLSKKRYVGYSYAYEDQKVPTFDAKGIETVRRDGIPAQQKIVEKSLRILFETCDLSKVKEYVQDQFARIMNNKISVQDFCFAKEVRVGTYKDERYAPAGAHVSKRLMEADKRAEPQFKERVPYVVLQSYKGKILRDRCVTPQFFLDNEVKEGLRLDYEYYITKALIPPLERIFNLVGVDVKAWYREMPRKMEYSSNYEDGGAKRRKLNNNLTNFLKFNNCLSCSSRTFSNRKLCEDCLKDELSTILKLTYRVQSAENDFRKLMMICRSCSSSGFQDSSFISDSVETAENCTSEDCTIFYSRLKAKKKLESMSVRESAVLEQFNEW